MKTVTPKGKKAAAVRGGVRPADDGTLAEQVQRSLEADIFSGALPPGSRLDEVELAARFDVSRTPIREALRYLASAELIEIRPRQPAVVVSLSAHKLIEMFQVMAELEGLCARLAARRISPAQLAQLREIQQTLAAQARSNDIDAFYETNRRFHEVIYDASQNEFLATQTRALRNRIGSYRRLVTQRAARRTATLDEHDDVVMHIAAGDEDAADRAMSAHVNLLGEKLLDFIALFPKAEAA